MYADRTVSKHLRPPQNLRAVRAAKTGDGYRGCRNRIEGKGHGQGALERAVPIYEELSKRAVHEEESQVLLGRNVKSALARAQSRLLPWARPGRWRPCREGPACEQRGKWGRWLRCRVCPCARMRRQSPQAKGPLEQPLKLQEKAIEACCCCPSAEHHTDEASLRNSHRGQCYHSPQKPESYFMYC